MTASRGAGGAARAPRRRLAVNGAQVDGWLWRARHAIRRREPRRALEAMLSALWLLGARDAQLAGNRRERRGKGDRSGIRAQLVEHDRRRSR